MWPRRTSGAALIVLALTACRPLLTAESPAPPGRAARLDEVTDFWGLDHYRLEMSSGVALALSCERGGPCEHLRVSSEDPAIAEIWQAALATLHPSGVANQASMAAAVVIGKAPGRTRLHVRSDHDHGGRWIDVSVVAVSPAGRSPSAPP
jgi:hypothetical protein